MSKYEADKSWNLIEADLDNPPPVRRVPMDMLPEPTGRPKPMVWGKPRRRYRSDHVLHIDALHRVLWRRAGPSHRIVLNSREIASEFDVNRDKAAIAIVQLRTDGRIAEVGKADRNLKRYEVTDPATYDPDDPTTHAGQGPRPSNLVTDPGPTSPGRTIQWG